MLLNKIKRLIKWLYEINDKDEATKTTQLVLLCIYDITAKQLPELYLNDMRTTQPTVLCLKPHNLHTVCITHGGTKAFVLK